MMPPGKIVSAFVNGLNVTLSTLDDRIDKPACVSAITSFMTAFKTNIDQEGNPDLCRAIDVAYDGNNGDSDIPNLTTFLQNLSPGGKDFSYKPTALSAIANYVENF